MDPTARFIQGVKESAAGAYQPAYDDTKAQDNLRDRPAGTYLCRPSQSHPGLLILNVVDKEKTIMQKLLKIDSRGITVLNEDGSQEITRYKNLTELFRDTLGTLATIAFSPPDPTILFLQEVNKLRVYQRFDEAKAQEQLKDKPIGSYLFRPLENSPGKFVLNVVSRESGIVQLPLKIEEDGITVLSKGGKKYANLKELLEAVGATTPYEPPAEPPLTRQDYLQMIETDAGYRPDLQSDDALYKLTKQPPGTYLFCPSSRPDRWDIELDISQDRIVSTDRFKITDAGIILVTRDGIITPHNPCYKNLSDIFRWRGVKNPYKGD